jgi:hypothetical protein
MKQVERARKAETYRSELCCMSDQTVWHTLFRATVQEPEDVPSGFEWRIDVMRFHLIMREWRGVRFLEDPATMGLEPGSPEHAAWAVHSARRFDNHDPLANTREALARQRYGDAEYERLVADGLIAEAEADRPLHSTPADNSR